MNVIDNEELLSDINIYKYYAERNAKNILSGPLSLAIVYIFTMHIYLTFNLTCCLVIVFPENSYKTV